MLSLFSYLNILYRDTIFRIEVLCVAQIMTINFYTEAIQSEFTTPTSWDIRIYFSTLKTLLFHFWQYFKL